MVRFCIERDDTAHLMFSPLQTEFAQELAKEFQMPVDLSTAIFIDAGVAYQKSSGILQMLRHLRFPWSLLALVALFIPTWIRNVGYNMFARYRSDIWKGVKKVTGIGDTMLAEHRHRILGLKDQVPASWGFEINPIAEKVGSAL